MTDLRTDAASADIIAEREMLAPEPGFREAFAAVVLGRPSTVIAFVVVLLFIAVAILAPMIAPYDPLRQSMLRINQTPSAQHWLGTDQFGRDVLSRLIHGSRNSLIFGLLSPVFAALFGTILGVAAGYFGGIVDRVISRVIDMLMAFPELLLAILIAAALGGSFWNIVVVLTVAFTPALPVLPAPPPCRSNRNPMWRLQLRRGFDAAHHHPAYRSQHLGADRRADGALVGQFDPHRGNTVLPRHRDAKYLIRPGATSSATG